MNLTKERRNSFFLRHANNLKAVLATLLITFAIQLNLNAQAGGTVLSFGEGIKAKNFYSSTVDKNNVAWFLTDAGIVSFDGTKWTLQNKNQKLVSSDLKSITSTGSSAATELLLATPAGAKVALLPIADNSTVVVYGKDNSKLLSENVLALASGNKDLKWFGTDKGVFALRNDKWLVNNYEDRYDQGIFEAFPITSMATDLKGDSLFIGTIGSGVLRVYRNDVDAVSGASEYMAWGPILMPSDDVYCIHISSDGRQWFGTDKGAAVHKGFRTLEGWNIFTTADGLADNFVQSINSDSKGNIYFGTKNGLTVFNGTTWSSMKVENGIVSNNILTVAVDKNGIVMLGTDAGVSVINNGKIINYR
jgi:ligand-binding sensor domain-containing protein